MRFQNNCSYKKGTKMIVTLSGITGIGKSFFKNTIVKELGFTNLVIVTTRNRRNGEINGIDKEFVSDEEFEQLRKDKKIVVDFEFLGAKYAYRKKDIESDKNQVTEVHYSTIYEFKKCVKNVFSIYMIPKDVERAKIELKKRNLPIEIEQKRLKEIQEHIEEYSKNENLRKQFDCEFINDYTEEAKNKLLQIIKNKLAEGKKI